MGRDHDDQESRPSRRWYDRMMGTGPDSRTGSRRVPLGRSIERDEVEFPDGTRDARKESIMDESINDGIPEVREINREHKVRCELCRISVPRDRIILTPGGHYVCEDERIVCYYEQCDYPNAIIEPPERAVFYPPLPERGMPYHRRCAQKVAREDRARRTNSNIGDLAKSVVLGWLDWKMPCKFGGGRNGKKR